MWQSCGMEDLTSAPGGSGCISLVSLGAVLALMDCPRLASAVLGGCQGLQRAIPSLLLFSPVPRKRFFTVMPKTPSLASVILQVFYPQFKNNNAVEIKASRPAPPNSWRQKWGHNISYFLLLGPWESLGAQHPALRDHPQPAPCWFVLLSSWNLKEQTQLFYFISRLLCVSCSM